MMTRINCIQLGRSLVSKASAAVIFAAFLGAGLATGFVPVDARADLRSSIADLSTQTVVNWRDTAIDVDALSKYYGKPDALPIWTNQDGPTARAFQLIMAIATIGSDGLDPADYMRGLPADLGSVRGETELARLEMALSQAALRMARDLYGGSTTPSIEEPDIVIPRKTIPVAQLLARMRRDLPDALAGLRPRHRQYAQLRQMLSAYRQMESRGSWPLVSVGATLKPGMSSPRVAELRKTLAARGYDGIRSQTPEIFDDQLADAVKSFQKRHGLKQDGVAGPNTLKALGVTLEQRVHQLIVNLERWRWLPRDLGRRYVLVNTAGFQMYTYDDRAQVDERKVIVGKPYHRTPMFSDAISYAEFNPTWTPTRNIAGNEFLPKLKKNPGYLSAAGYKLYANWKSGARPISAWKVNWHKVSASRFPYRIVQQAGPKNALGRVKFMFPNKFSIYLHDTPSRSLFERSGRAFSHGCIRVHQPMEFAELLFAMDGGPSRASIDSIVNSRRTQAVRLKQKVPVHLTYFSVWIDEDGFVQFYDDLYSRDELVRTVLQGEV